MLKSTSDVKINFLGTDIQWTRERVFLALTSDTTQIGRVSHTVTATASRVHWSTHTASLALVRVLKVVFRSIGEILPVSHKEAHCRLHAAFARALRATRQLRAA
jgi:hypothetical protein